MEAPARTHRGTGTGASGDQCRLEALIKQHLKAVWRLAFHLMLDHSLADDVTQEACLRAIRGYSQFQGGSSFRTWLFRIVINTAHDARAEGRRAAAQMPDEGIVFDRPTKLHEAPEQGAMRAELEKAIAQAMAELPEPLRVALVLTSHNGLTPQEVAELESCTVSTVYWRIHKARKLLRERLKPWTH